jgi:hypothetical protein
MLPLKLNDFQFNSVVSLPGSLEDNFTSAQRATITKIRLHIALNVFPFAGLSSYYSMAPLSQLLPNVDTVIVETADVHVPIGPYTHPDIVRGWVVGNEQWLTDWSSRGGSGPLHVIFDYAPFNT